MTFNAGDKVKVRGMDMPGEVVSGPWKSPGNDRYLVRRADGFVSLIPVQRLTRIKPRLDRVADLLAYHMFGVMFERCSRNEQIKLARLAGTVIHFVDTTKGQP